MNDKFQSILSSLPEKAPRSRLAPYYELIEEHRCRGRTYREIERILVDQCQLQKACEPMRSLIIIGLQTGLRINREALTLTWDSINLRGQTLTIEAAFSKTHEMREVVLNSIALETLRRLKETTPGPWVFMTRGKKKDGPWRQLKSFKSAFDRACRRANLSGGRRTVCGTLGQAGWK